MTWLQLLMLWGSAFAFSASLVMALGIVDITLRAGDPRAQAKQAVILLVVFTLALGLYFMMTVVPYGPHN